MSSEGFKITIVTAGSPDHLSDLALLRERNLPLPHTYSRWSISHSGAAWRWVRILRPNGELLSALALSLHYSRAVPGMRIGRVHRFGRALHGPIAANSGALLLNLAANIPRLLRLDVGLFDENSQRARIIANSMARSGWKPSRQPSSYSHTLRVELDGRSETELSLDFNQRTRRNIRKMSAHTAFTVGPITNNSYRGRIRQLFLSSFQHSHGLAPELDVNGLLADAADPNNSLLVGVFDHRRPQPDDLVAFGWATNQGDHGCYEHGGTERLGSHLAPGALVMWEMIRWSHQQGHQWFDLGGLASDASNELRGINEFKYGFSQNRIEVGKTFEYQPATRLTAVARKSREYWSILKSAKLGRR